MPVRAARIASPVFVGRAEEMERVDCVLEAASSGRPGVLLVAGEAGIGKSRFAEEIAGRAAARSFRVLTGRCVDAVGGALPFAPFVDVLRTLARETSPAMLDELLGSGRRELSRLLPGLEPAELTSNPGEFEQFTQIRLFELWLALLERLAASAPVLLVVEDIHWADASTLDLLAYLSRMLRDGPIVVAATYRSDELHRRHPLRPFLAELDRSGRAERIELARLDRGECAAQLAGILGHEPDATLLDDVWQRSEGNPFYSEELLAAGERAALPDSLRELLLARVATVGPLARRVLSVAAVGREHLTVPLLFATAGLAETAALEGLRKAVEAHLLVAARGARGEHEERYVFRHALVAEAVYEELLPVDRVAIHAAFAAALAPEAAADPSLAGQVAHHWLAARDLEQAFRASLSAADAAERTFAFPEALDHLERALELWDRVPAAAAQAGFDRVSLHERTAAAAGYRTPGRAVALLRAAIALVDESADPVRAGLLYERLAHHAWDALPADEAMAASRRAVALVPADPPSRVRAVVLAGLGRSLMLRSEWDEATSVCRDAARVARTVGARDVEGHALASLGPALAVSGDVGAGLAATRQARAIGLEIGDQYLVARASFNLVGALEDGDLEERLEEARTAFDHARRFGLARSIVGVGDLVVEADTLILLGRWDEARTVTARARSFGLGGVTSLYLGEEEAELLVEAGGTEEAVRVLEAARLQARDLWDADCEIEYARIGALLALWRGDAAAARHAVERFVMPLARSTGRPRAALIAWTALRTEADLALAARDDREAAAGAEALRRGRAILAELDELDARPVTSPRIVSGAFVLAARAEFERLNATADAPRAWSQAVLALDKAMLPFHAAYARYRLAEVLLLERSGRMEAAGPLRDAHAVAARLGARPLVGAIEGLARRGRIELAPAAANEPAESVERAAPSDARDRYRLSRREREVLALVAEGRTNREIGDRLFISESTAGVHVTHILDKLGVPTRAAAAALAARRGLLDAPDA